ncbi:MULTISPECIES: GtrA family protein [unclassified Corynebacterium]|uniref:GtrA family protein n=1 Tax=unclassified Corynebacterium TaxID=2624378 RepID=UPI0029CA34E6|nr:MULTISPECIES: GtrA family protein [unclassified Corynebacterium]WPF66245.1 GtrA family protein [Corynebacterium sp. 22KM0430]WPF68735.1 GtrA family protein [Corynebacterium sp. 21KM1197]
MQDLKSQGIRFLISGGISAVVDLGLTWICNVVVGMSIPASRTIGFIFGTLVAYMINRRWTFRAEPSWRRFLAVMGLYAITYGVNVGGQTLGQRLFQDWGWDHNIALVVAFVLSQGTATVINFVMQRTFIFRVK